MKLTKIKSGETAYIAAMILSAIGIRMQVNAGLGISMVAAPAYILSVRISWLTQGNAEWMIQGFLYVTMCLAIRRFAYKKIWSFIAAIPYGWLFDWISSLMMQVKGTGFASNLLLFLIGSAILALGIALFFQSYLPCQMHEMFVKTLAQAYSWNQSKVKTVYDFSCLGVSLLLSLLFFHRLEGIGIGTVICTVINGPLIGFWIRLLDGKLCYDAAIPGLKRYFEA